jgi:hypothetical protein
MAQIVRFIVDRSQQRPHKLSELIATLRLLCSLKIMVNKKLLMLTIPQVYNGADNFSACWTGLDCCCAKRLSILSDKIPRPRTVAPRPPDGGFT